MSAPTIARVLARIPKLAVQKWRVAKYFRGRGRTKSVLGRCNRNCSYKTHVLEG